MHWTNKKISHRSTLILGLKTVQSLFLSKVHIGRQTVNIGCFYFFSFLLSLLMSILRNYLSKGYKASANVHWCRLAGTGHLGFGEGIGKGFTEYNICPSPKVSCLKQRLAKSGPQVKGSPPPVLVWLVS